MNPHRSLSNCSSSSELSVFASSSSCDVELGIHPKTPEEGPQSPDPRRSPSVSSGGSPRKLRGARAHIAASKSPDILQYFEDVCTEKQDLNSESEVFLVSKDKPIGDVRLLGNGNNLDEIPSTKTRNLVCELEKDMDMGGERQFKKGGDRNELGLTKKESDMTKVRPAMKTKDVKVCPEKDKEVGKKIPAKKSATYCIGEAMKTTFFRRIDKILSDELQKTKYRSEEDLFCLGYAAVLIDLEKEIIESLGRKDVQKETEKRRNEDNHFAQIDSLGRRPNQLKSKSNKAVHVLLDDEVTDRKLSLPELDSRRLFRRQMSSKPTSDMDRLLPLGDKPRTRVCVICKSLNTAEEKRERYKLLLLSHRAHTSKG